MNNIKNKHMKNINLFYLFIVLFSIGCSSGTDNAGDKITEKITKTKEQKKQKHEGTVRSVFYDIYSPVEMSSLFAKTGTKYDLSILNPVENSDNYLTSPKIASNLGVYGVDFSYNKMFNQTQQSVKYLACIQQLSEKLGIPQDAFSFTESRIEDKINDKDSLFIIAGKAYDSIDIYLKKNNRKSAASLIVMGGWVEALYIATNITNDLSAEMMGRIAEQKYSLNSLIVLLSNNQDDLTVAKYLILLKKLNKTFSQFEILYNNGDVSIDTINKKIIINKQHVEVSKEQIIRIKTIVNIIRADIVSY